MPSDRWAQHQWTWATEEQKQFLRDVTPFYRFESVHPESAARFWGTFRERWFLGWPIIPDLIELKQLPAGAQEDGYKLSKEEEELVNDYEDRQFKVGSSYGNLPPSRSNSQLESVPGADLAPPSTRSARWDVQPVKWPTPTFTAQAIQVVETLAVKETSKFGPRYSEPLGIDGGVC